MRPRIIAIIVLVFVAGAYAAVGLVHFLKNQPVLERLF
jgi:hypothetical protein